MSMTPFDGDDHNDDDGTDPAAEAFENEAFALTGRWENSDLEIELRKIGVYVKQQMVVPMPLPDGSMKPCLAVMAEVNRVAFTKRVLDPEAAEFDQQFRTMEVHAEDDAYLDARAQIEKNIAEGRDPFDDGPDAVSGDDGSGGDEA